MELITANPAIVWLVFGAIALVIEVISFSGIVFLYAGLSAIALGGLIIINVIPAGDFTVQLASFLGFSCLWAFLLWKPMKKFKSGNPDDNYSNIVGETAVIIKGDLVKGKPGKAKWSGTTMTARLSDESASASIAEGSEVSIVKIDGTTIFVKEI